LERPALDGQPQPPGGIAGRLGGFSVLLLPDWAGYEVQIDAAQD